MDKNWKLRFNFAIFFTFCIINSQIYQSKQLITISSKFNLHTFPYSFLYFLLFANISIKIPLETWNFTKIYYDLLTLRAISIWMKKLNFYNKSNNILDFCCVKIQVKLFPRNFHVQVLPSWMKLSSRSSNSCKGTSSKLITPNFKNNSLEYTSHQINHS